MFDVNDPSVATRWIFGSMPIFSATANDLTCGSASGPLIGTLIEQSILPSQSGAGSHSCPPGNHGTFMTRHLCRDLGMTNGIAFPRFDQRSHRRSSCPAPNESNDQPCPRPSSAVVNRGSLPEGEDLRTHDECGPCWRTRSSRIADPLLASVSGISLIRPTEPTGAENR